MHALKEELCNLRTDDLVERLLSARKDALNNERRADEWADKHDKATAIIKAACAVLSTVLCPSADILELCEAARVELKRKKEEVLF